MTRFSVIVPMRSTEAFADECLSSVQSQTGADLEVIAVDDDSPDGCGAIIDRHARADHRFTALHRDRSCGVGASRNAGIARANGEYLLFLDGDDAFHDRNVLAGLDDDLARTGDPDVLMFDYEQSRPCGLGRRSNLGWVVAVDAQHLLGQAERPEALRVSWVCWNKAYRRDSIARTGLRFPAGYYEDFVWSLCAVLAADRVAVSGRVGVDYRCCRTSSISRGVSPRHFEVFDQFDRILDFLHDHPEVDAAPVRTVLADAMTTFLRSRSERRRVVPPDLLPEFRRRSDELAARVNPTRAARRRCGRTAC